MGVAVTQDIILAAQALDVSDVQTAVLTARSLSLVTWRVATAF